MSGAESEKPFECRQCSKPLAFWGFCSVACHTAADGLPHPELGICVEDDIGCINYDMVCCGCAKHPERYTFIATQRIPGVY